MERWGGNTGWPTFTEYGVVRSVSALPETDRGFTNRLAQAPTEFGDHKQETKRWSMAGRLWKKPLGCKPGFCSDFFCTNLCKVTFCMPSLSFVN